MCIRDRAGAGQHVELFALVHGDAQVVAVDDLEIGRIEEAFEQQDRAAPTGLATAYGLVQVQHCLLYTSRCV